MKVLRRHGLGEKNRRFNLLIILEGPDGSGKSQLAADLEDFLHRTRKKDMTEIQHSGPPTRHPLDEYQRSINWYRPSEGNHMILDRWHWGEHVYPDLFERSSKLDVVNLWHIEHFLLRLGAIVVQVDQYPDEYRRVYAERNDTFEQTILPEVQRRYRRMRKMTCLPVVDYNWMSPIHGDIHRVIELAAKQEKLFTDLNRFNTYVGPRRPRALLLGDVRHPNRGPAFDPAFVPFVATSGHYLIESVMSGGQTGDTFSYGLANACDQDDAYALWQTLGRPNIVALGHNARDAINRQVKLDGFSARGAVPHPQYIRRFHHNDQYAYGQNIRQAAKLGGDYSKWHTQLRDERVKTSTSRSSKRSDDTVKSESPATV
jgi:hypothetical protein